MDVNEMGTFSDSNNGAFRTAIVDPVGKKAGLDCYNDSLAKVLNSENSIVKVYSNYSSKYSTSIFDFSFGRSILFIPKLILSYRKTIKILKEERFDSVIIHLFKATKIDLWFLKKLKTEKIKCVCILHDIENLVSERASNGILQNCLGLVDNIIVHNLFSKKELLRLIPDLKERVEIVGHGDFLDLPSGVSKWEAIQKLGLTSIKRKVLFFGMIKPSKGLDVLLKAMQGVDAELIIAGRMRKHSFSEYSKLIQPLKVKNKIILDINYITNEKRDLYFKVADIIVLPYRKIYQSGVLIMALSYKIPAVTSDLPPILEFVEDADCVHLFRDGDHEDLAVQINDLLLNEQKRKKLVENGERKLKKSNNWGSIGNSFKRILAK